MVLTVELESAPLSCAGWVFTGAVALPHITLFVFVVFCGCMVILNRSSGRLVRHNVLVVREPVLIWHQS